MDDDDGGPQFLFAVLSYPHKSSDFCSILRLKLDTSKLIKRKEDEDYVARFSKPRAVPLITWLFSPPTSCTEYNMYLVPDYLRTYKQIPKPLHGKEFNLLTRKCQQIKAPLAPKASGRVVNSGGLIFYMSHPNCYFDAPDPVFECYDPKKNKWKPLQPFPRHDVYLNSYHIVATAVLGDTILYNMTSCQLWAYYVPTDKWYIVHTDDDQCYYMFGEAVVLGNTIYALTKSPDSILALSLKITDGRVPVFSCSLLSLIKVEGLKQIKYDDEGAHMKSRHLVHLGGDDFCLVQSCKFYDLFGRCQPIQLTRIKRTGEISMTLMDIILHEVKVLDDEQFEVRLGFSLPEYKTTVVKEGKGFYIPLTPESGFVKSVQAPTHGVGSSSGRRNTDEEGHCVYVRNWPPEASFNVFVEKVMGHGRIKRDGIQFWQNKEGDCWCASAEFEKADSKERALKAPPLRIGGYVLQLEGV